MPWKFRIFEPQMSQMDADGTSGVLSKLLCALRVLDEKTAVRSSEAGRFALVAAGRGFDPGQR
jgi:hypothetical protein